MLGIAPVDLRMEIGGFRVSLAIERAAQRGHLSRSAIQPRGDTEAIYVLEAHYDIAGRQGAAGRVGWDPGDAAGHLVHARVAGFPGDAGAVRPLRVDHDMI